MFKQKLRKFFKRRKKLRIAIIVILIIVVSLFCLAFSSGIPKVETPDTYNGENNYIRFYEKPYISAHRAGGAIAPENTLAAFMHCMNASDYRVDILEFDLHLTKDNVLILLHDDTLDRTSNAQSYFGEKNIYAKDKLFSELKNLNMAENFENENSEFPYRGLRGDDIPNEFKIISLTEVLEYLKPYNLHYIIEIKDDGKLGERATDLLYDEMRMFDILDKTIVGTFNKNVTKYIDNNYPQITRSAGIAEVLDFYLCSIFNINILKKNYKFDVLQIPYKDFGINFGKKSIVDYAHHYGIAVQYWTINDENDIKHLVEIGADAIISDSPDIAYKIINNN